jgi:hypothetical protein
MRDAAAGARALALVEAMAAGGCSPVSLLTGGAVPVPLAHYPDGDIYDFASHAQAYYHLHRRGETGHVHLFLRPRGMPPGLAPLLPPPEPNSPCHLAAIGLDAAGQPTELFTTNRWVTGEAWYSAAAVTAMLPRFRLAAAGRLQPVAEFLEALVAFYAKDIADLVCQRDAAVAAWGKAHPGVFALDDPRLEVTSRRAVDLFADASPSPGRGQG